MSLLRNLKLVKVLGRSKKRKTKQAHVLSDQKAAAKWSVDHWNTSGTTKLAELEKITDKSFGSGTESMTISDFVKLKLNRMPNPGDEIVENGLSFLVLNIKSFRVGDVQIRLVASKNS